MNYIAVAALTALIFSSCTGVAKTELGEGGDSEKGFSHARTTSIFIVYDKGAYPPSEPYRIWLENSDIPNSLSARFPVSFKNVGGNVTLEMNTSISGYREVTRRKIGENPAVEEIVFEIATKIPSMPGKVVTLSFAAAELYSTNGKVSTQPEIFALLKAARSSGLKEGTVWVRRVRYNSGGLFEVEVQM